jgi:uncharacterized caspase-like protein
VEVTATDDHQIVRVEVRVNGRPVHVEVHVGPPKPIELGGRPSELGGRPIPTAHRLTYHIGMNVPLPVGEKQVTLKAIAYDDEALQGWAELHLTRTLAAAAGPHAAAPGDLYVLAVGVSQYRNPDYNLKFAAADAEAFAGLWKPMEGTLYRHVIVRRLTDSQATQANVRAALFKLFEAATNTDTVALFLSGHGVQVGEGQFYFATSDIDAATPERVEETALPWKTFQTTLAKVSAKRVCLFLDACHSGNALGARQAGNERLAEALARRGTALVFTSSRGGEVSYEDPALHHGAFTAALLEGIGEGQADVPIRGRRDGNITAAKLLTYLQTRVPELTGNRQTPSAPLIYDFGETFLLARTR